MIRIYISGPISGYDTEERKAAFAAAENELKGMLKCVVVNPMKDQPEGWTWEEYMERDLELVETCDLMVMLPGWEASRGAVIERRRAEELGMVAVELEEKG